MERSFTVGSLKPMARSPMRPVLSEPTKPTARPTVIQVEQNGTSFAIQPTRGLSLLDAALRQGIPLDYKCKKGTCGRCMVTVLAGAHLLAPKTRREREKTDQPAKRLACQAPIQ